MKPKTWNSNKIEYGIVKTCRPWIIFNSWYCVRRQNTYLINFGLYKSSKILTHDLHHANNVIFNYKYDLVAIRLYTVAKDFMKTTKNIGQTSKLHLVATKS
jgi:hypothetical protein